MKEKEIEKTDNVKIIKTDEDAKNGQNKCPKCGATDISLNVNNGKLRCNFCRFEFEPKKIAGMEDDISKLNNDVIASGALDISRDAKDVLTFKCSSCGAEVVIDTKSSTQSRCHWCRNTLSVNEQIPNGSVPDVVLPFNITKNVAIDTIKKFVGKRKFYAHPKFRKEFSAENVMGVYFPYMIVDINSHEKLVGKGEHQVRKYVKGSGDSAKTYYDADVYNVEREFDLAIKGLTVESSSDKLNKKSKNKTNNIINAIMPFDVENSVKYDSNYLKGYTSEKRDTNIKDLTNLVEIQSKDIAKFKANETLKNYDRGVAWSLENLDIKGTQWKAAYLPVWLYSYKQEKGNSYMLHYVAVNARTKEVMGSVPIYMPKLIGISVLVEILGIILMMFVDSDYSYLFLTIGIIYFLTIYFKYRNSNARHKYETETKSEMSNLRKVDTYLTRKTGLTNSKIEGVNNTTISGSTNNILNSYVNDNLVSQIIKDKNR